MSFLATLLPLWKLARPFLPYILAALALIGLIFAIEHHGYAKGRASRDKDVAALNTKLAASNASVDKLMGQIATQNAAVASLQHESDSRQAEGAKALKAAQDRAKTASGLADRLEASSHAASSKDCATSKVLLNAKDQL